MILIPLFDKTGCLARGCNADARWLPGEGLYVFTHGPRGSEARLTITDDEVCPHRVNGDYHYLERRFIDWAREVHAYEDAASEREATA